ncbi:transporter substrate-binding domain-containing protein [Marinobacter sp. S0848L]|uniref:transporter substrate-binding domain-containing protein n=1 Tax=Marinobacter sp. S0848L TaxID=2926423 RepID=UPI001FF339E6|nr:transporter substrate-binding domain-containing protein [Marinobacter sp. S0848L]
MGITYVLEGCSMRLGLLIILALWTLPAASQTLRIMGADDGFLPFYYGKNLDNGIFVQVMNEFALEAGITAHFRPMARKRQAWALEKGIANAVFANPLWMPSPERMQSVGPVFTWRDRVFAQPGQQPTSFDDLKGRICLRKWFVYSDGLERRIGNNLERLDAYNAQHMLRMFLLKRCDYIVMNETEFRFLALHGNFDAAAYNTDLVDTEWPVYLGILKTEAALIEAAEAFFATYKIDVEAMLPILPLPDRRISIMSDK